MPYKYILFTERVHQVLLKEGYHAIRAKDDHIPQKCGRGQKSPKGYILRAERYKNKDANGKWVYMYEETEILFYNYYSKDPDDQRTKDFYNRYPMMKPKDTEGLKGATKKKAELHHHARTASIDKFPLTGVASDIEVEFPLTHELVEGLYSRRCCRYYIRLSVGYNRGSFRKLNFQLYKKLFTASDKNLRLLGGR